MKKCLLFVLFFITQLTSICAQSDTVISLIKKTYMIPMRDGVKLFTVVLSPANYSKPVPFLIQRTPYGSDIPLKEDSAVKVNLLPVYYHNMAKEGYIFGWLSA